MARPQPRVDGSEEPPVDRSQAIEQAYRFHRARRRARVRRQTEKRTANVRFYIVLTALVFVLVLIALAAWNEIQRVFGL
jgi:hypothetical protein